MNLHECNWAENSDLLIYWDTHGSFKTDHRRTTGASVRSLNRRRGEGIFCSRLPLQNIHLRAGTIEKPLVCILYAIAVGRSSVNVFSLTLETTRSLPDY